MLARLGVIALVFGLTISLGQAQEQAEDPNSTAAKQQYPAQTFPVPLPVDIIEDQTAAEARQRSEEEARDREIRDLAAQEGMNAATQSIEAATRDMRDYALYSTILVALGTFMLGITLWLTRQANRAAQDAVEVSRDIGMRQVRAYTATYTSQVTNFVPGKIPSFETEFRNFGQSPAYITVAVLGIRCVDNPDQAKFFFNIDKKRPRGGGTISAGGTKHDFLSFAEALDEATYDEVIAGKKYFIFGGYMIYKDVFSITRRHVFRLLLKGSEIKNGTARLHIANKNNRSN